MAVAVAVAVSGGGAVAVAGLTKRFFNHIQKDFLIDAKRTNLRNEKRQKRILPFFAELRQNASSVF